MHYNECYKVLEEKIMTKITILGCGGSDGVPMIGCRCEICRSKNPKNKRLRQSICIESGQTKLLIDAGPDLRTQSLTHKINRLDGILITHAHSDHVGGLQDLRPFCVSSHQTINLYSMKKFLDDINIRFDYLFKDCRVAKDISMPIIKANMVKPWVKNKVGDIEFIPFIQEHGPGESLGFLFNNFAYSTDLHALSQRSLDLLKGTKLWLIDCLGYKRIFPSHLSLESMLNLYEKVQPEKAILIHMSHEIDYETFHKKLPKNIKLAYDGLQIIV
jgi:phosphoribosyl 1,2-cyclic phosphate phosphodiesterase